MDKIYILIGKKNFKILPYLGWAGSRPKKGIYVVLSSVGFNVGSEHLTYLSSQGCHSALVNWVTVGGIYIQYEIGLLLQYFSCQIEENSGVFALEYTTRFWVFPI